MKITINQYDKEYIIETESDDLTSHETLDIFLSLMRGMSYGETAINRALTEAVSNNTPYIVHPSNFTKQQKIKALGVDIDMLNSSGRVLFRDEEDFICKPEKVTERPLKIDETKDIHKEPEFKVGDKVEVVSVGPLDKDIVSVGDLYVVEEINERGCVFVDVGLELGNWILIPGQVKKVKQ